jgi:hypothetical protein
MTLRRILSVLVNVALLALSGCPVSLKRTEAPLPEVGSARRSVPVVLLIDAALSAPSRDSYSRTICSNARSAEELLQTNEAARPALIMGGLGFVAGESIVRQQDLGLPAEIVELDSDQRVATVVLLLLPAPGVGDPARAIDLAMDADEVVLLALVEPVFPEAR